MAVGCISGSWWSMLYSPFGYLYPPKADPFASQYINLSALHYNRVQQAINRPPTACRWCGRTFDKSELDRASCRTCGGYK